MVVRLDRSQLIARDEIVAAPTQRACQDRTFGLPPILHVGTFALFLTYIGVMALGFPHPQMVLPVAIFVVFIIAFCAVPALWTLMDPADSRTPAMRWDRFIDEGIMTETGHSSGRSAAVLVLMLPFLILCWGVAVVTIAALV